MPIAALELLFSAPGSAMNKRDILNAFVGYGERLLGHRFVVIPERVCSTPGLYLDTTHYILKEASPGMYEPFMRLQVKDSPWDGESWGPIDMGEL